MRYVDAIAPSRILPTVLIVKQVFDGPISESIPSSVVSFLHRRNRTGSTVSFTYFQDGEDFAEWSNEDAVEEDLEDMSSGFEEESADGLAEADVESSRGSFISKRHSQSRDSVEQPLLSRYMSASSYGRDRRSGSRLNQKVYIASEDLTAVFAGFSTSAGGFAFYIGLCILTGGFAYLVLRWLPRWRIRLIGKAAPLGKCQWIAIEVRLTTMQYLISAPIKSSNLTPGPMESFHHPRSGQPVIWASTIHCFC